MQKIVSMIVGIISLALTMSVVAEPVSNTTGTFEVRVEKVPIARYTGSSDTIQSAVGIEIINKSSEPMCIALMGPLTLQLDDGTDFGKQYKISGLTECQRETLKDCDRSGDEFEVLSPSQEASVNVLWYARRVDMKLEGVRFARISGSLFVRNQASGKSWKQTISLKNISVDNHVR